MNWIRAKLPRIVTYGHQAEDRISMSLVSRGTTIDDQGVLFCQPLMYRLRSLRFPPVTAENMSSQVVFPALVVASSKCTA